MNEPSGFDQLFGFHRPGNDPSENYCMSRQVILTTIFDRLKTINGDLKLRYQSNETAKLLGISPIQLGVLRASGRGPKFTATGKRKFYYDLVDIVEWLESQKKFHNLDEVKHALSKNKPTV